MNTLQKITARAKQIRKASPGMQWKNAIKKAGAEYRSGTGSTAAKKKAAKKPRVSGHSVKSARVSATKERVKHLGISGTTSSLVSELKKRIVDRIDKAVVRKYHATTKKAKRDLQKVISAGKAQLKKLS